MFHQDRTVIAQVRCIARAHPGVDYHAHLRHEGDKRMMGRSAGFARIVANLCSLLLPVSRDNAAVQIEGHIVKMELFKEPPLK
jgi:hypothetical protein